MLSLVQGYSVILKGALSTKEDSLYSWLNFNSPVFNITLRSSSHLQWRSILGNGLRSACAAVCRQVFCQCSLKLGSSGKIG